MSTSQHQLFQPTRVGRIDLQHRVVLAPLTRTRASLDHVANDMMKEHYSMRATVPGTLLVTEANFLALRDTAVPFWRQPPGLWNDAQTAGWKKIVDAVHDRGSFIYAQLWGAGRLTSPEILSSLDPSFRYYSAGTAPVTGWSRAPEAMTKDDIKTSVSAFADAAERAVQGAGFDGVEFQALYLVEEFLKNISNDRTDEYGFQNPENATRFFFEVLDAIIERVGADRVGLKINPWMRMKALDGGVEQSDPLPVYTYLATEVRKRYPDLAYLHVLEPRIEGFDDVETSEKMSNDFLRAIWAGKPYIADGGFKRDSAIAEADEHENELVMFGRLYTSNPDLPVRLEHDIPLTHYDRSSFYLDGSEEGYNTYKFAEESRRILAARGIDVRRL